MEYINSFTYCDKIITEMNPQNGMVQRNVISPLNELRPVSIPGNYTFSIACGISKINPEKQNHFIFRFISPDGKEITPIDAIVPPASIVQADGQQVDNINMDLEFRNLVLTVEGIYKTVVEVNNKILGEYLIEVKAGAIR